MRDLEIVDGNTSLVAWPSPQGRRVYIQIGEAVIEGDAYGLSLNPEQAHDLIAVLRPIAQRRIPDDTEDGAYEGADSAYSAQVDDLRGVL